MLRGVRYYGAIELHIQEAFDLYGKVSVRRLDRFGPIFVTFETEEAATRALGCDMRELRLALCADASWVGLERALIRAPQPPTANGEAGDVLQLAPPRGGQAGTG